MTASMSRKQGVALSASSVLPPHVTSECAPGVGAALREDNHRARIRRTSPRFIDQGCRAGRSWQQETRRRPVVDAACCRGHDARAEKWTVGAQKLAAARISRQVLPMSPPDLALGARLRACVHRDCSGTARRWPSRSGMVPVACTRAITCEGRRVTLNRSKTARRSFTVKRR